MKAVIHMAWLCCHWSGASLNARQVKMLNKMLDGFEGNMTNKKWVALNKCSPDTALRDIKELMDRGLLANAGAGGRSTHYVLCDLQNLVSERSGKT
ncbi:MAG: hypothetical protein AAB278_00905 [Pseudomonadota bacterium]